MDKLDLSNDEYDDCNEDNNDRNGSDQSSTISRNKLPILDCKGEIIELIRNNQIVIIQGETGCGKTTQIPQFIFDSNLNNKSCIGVTQSRKIAAVSMAKRVSQERNCGLGKEIGYEIRFDKKCSGSTKIKYMTDGILLNECVINKRLTEYSVIMIDEAHERSVNSDILLGLLKLIVKYRDDLKIVITSATISTEKFSKYFNDAKIYIIEGHLYPIDIIYCGYCSDYVRQAIGLVHKIHFENEPGDILLFLTGEEEINDCCDKLYKTENLVVRPLYGAIDFQSQQKVFTNVEPNQRKLVVATNIAETSLTIDGIRYVIDCGYVKQTNYVSRRGIDTLESVRISKAQAEQRKGRAGRTSSGFCYRLYTEKTFNEFIPEAIPEIHRKNLSEIYLRLIEINQEPKKFEYIDRPSDEELERSQKELLELSLINTNEKLTPVGTSMVGLPVEPCLGKVILTSVSNKCSLDILKIMSMFSEKFVFFRKRKNQRQNDIIKNPFHDPEGDHFTFLNVFNEWEKNKKNKQWCISNAIDFSSMNTVHKIFDQLHRMLKKKFPNLENSSSRVAIKKSIISGYFKNICVKQSRDSYIRIYGREVLFIHPQSSLFQSCPKIILFNEVRRTTRAYMHGVLQLDEEMIKGFTKEMKLINFPENLDNLSDF